MVIPGCNSGNLNRGGDGGVCHERGNDGACLKMRGCDDNSLFKQYSSTDIIMSDDQNRCYRLAPNRFTRNEYFTHQAVIVGWGRHDIVQYALVKQSWGAEFGV